MGQFFGSEKITKLQRLSNTQVSLPAGFSLKIGGQGQSSDSALTLTSSVSGIGGLDTGSIANLTFYYVYVVYNGSVLGLVASTSATAPTGFLAYRKVGAFYTNSSAQILRAYWFGEENQQYYTSFVDSAGTSTGQFPSGWIGSTSVPSTGRRRLTFSSSFTLAEAPSGAADSVSASGSIIAEVATSDPTFIDVQGVIPNQSLLLTSFFVTVLKRGVDAIQPDWSL